MQRLRPGRDQGFSLVELMVAMMLFGIIVAIGVGPFRDFNRAQQHRGSTRKLVGVLRNAQVKASAEAATYRVDFNPDKRSVTVYRLDGAGWTEQLTHRATEKSIYFAEPEFADGTSVYFYARGSASKGKVFVRSDDSATQYVVSVEGLTARVSYE